MSNEPWRVAWITGASSGVGRELALRLARNGVVVAASARTAEKLAELAALSPNIRAYPVDVTDAAAMAKTVADIERDLGPIDLALFNAGIWQPMGVSDYDLAAATRANAVNYLGVINGLAPIMPLMCARGSGQIAFLGSVAGYRGLGKIAAYGPTKAALINLAESLYPQLQARGVKMTMINPGYIDTPMVANNDFPMPFLISTDDAVSRIHKGLKRDKFEVVFPAPTAILLKLLRIIRYRQYFRIASRM